MGILGSAFGRGLASAGDAVASIAGKYIDQGLQMERDQFLSDLQTEGFKKQQTFMVSPEITAGKAAQTKAVTMAEGEGRTAAEKSALSDPGLAALRSGDTKRQAVAQGEGVRAATMAGIQDEGFQKAVEAQRLRDANVNVQIQNLTVEGTAESLAKADALKARLKQASDIDLAVSLAGNPAAQKALWAAAMTNPQVAAAYAAHMAAAGASNASAAEHRVRTEQLSGDMAQINTMRQLARSYSDMDPNDPAQAANRQRTEQRMTDIGFSGKNLKGFLELADKAIERTSSALKILADPGADEAAKAAASRALDQGMQIADQAAKAGGLTLKEKVRQPTPQDIKDALKRPELRGQFEQWFGKERADKELGPASKKDDKASDRKSSGIVTNGFGPSETQRDIKKMGNAFFFNGRSYETKDAALSAEFDLRRRQRVTDDLLSESSLPISSAN